MPSSNARSLVHRGDGGEAPGNVDRLGGAIGKPGSKQPAKRQAAIIWPPQQTKALGAVRSWLTSRSTPFFYLAGYAGTGKSTLAAEIALRHGGEVLFAAFTGKAAAVMRSKGCTDATTIDALIYRAQLQISCAAEEPCDTPPCGNRCRYARERFIGRTLNVESDVAHASLIIIDEVSMVGERMGRDLLSFAVPVLVIGDVAQLPPIGDGGYFTRGEPDFQLTEVHRQAFDSPVIELATRARRRQPLRHGTYGESAVVEEIGVEEMLTFDQVICGTHRTRHKINKEIRKALGFRGPTPEAGEKAICLKNNRRLGLRNGTIWTVTSATPSDGGFVEMIVENEEGERVEVLAPEEGFSSRDGNGQDLPEQPFAFGYCITCHKAQGSQWDSVLVLDESYVFRGNRWRWLYTAVTRAAERVTIVC
jgi:exodeoxyribonuclease-5